MLTFFRNFFKTKIGLALALAFLGLIGFAFASMDVSNTGAFGGVAGGDSVAVVGEEKIGTAELNQAASEELRRARQEDTSLTMQALLAGNGIDDILDDLISRYALNEWSEENGLRAGTNLVNSEIRTIPAARGPSGEFSSDAYNLFLRSNSLTDARFREQLRTSLFFQQVVVPAAQGTQLPESIARAYARSFKERRTGAIQLIPAALYAPESDPSEEQLSEFYSENRSRFIRPERRVLRFATFDSAALGDSIEPSAEEIAAYFEANFEQYAARETRSFTQLIVPTNAGAEAIANRVRSGESFAQASAGAGLRPVSLEDQERSDIRSAASSAVAAAYFSAAEGTVTSPVRSALGWHIARVDAVNRTPARNLAEASEDISAIVREEKRQRGIAELAVGIEDRLADGASLTAVAEELDLELQTTPPLTSAGLIYGTAQSVPPLLTPVLELAFQIDEGEAEIGALPDQQTFLLYEVADITPSAAAPLAEIRQDVVGIWRLVRGNERAEQAADRILSRIAEGQSMAEAISAEEVDLPSPQTANISREELSSFGAGGVPAPLALLFAMANDTSKKLEDPRSQGWYVVDLENIEVGELAANDPILPVVRSQIGNAWGSEYAEQMLAAMAREVGVERNPDAIAAVRRQLLGETN